MLMHVTLEADALCMIVRKADQPSTQNLRYLELSQEIWRRLPKRDPEFPENALIFAHASPWASKNAFHVAL
jgi:hypothetical protein